MSAYSKGNIAYGCIMCLRSRVCTSLEDDFFTQDYSPTVVGRKDFRDLTARDDYRDCTSTSWIIDSVETCFHRYSVLMQCVLE